MKARADIRKVPHAVYEALHPFVVAAVYAPLWQNANVPQKIKRMRKIRKISKCLEKSVMKTGCPGGFRDKPLVVINFLLYLEFHTIFNRHIFAMIFFANRITSAEIQAVFPRQILCYQHSVQLSSCRTVRARWYNHSSVIRWAMHICLSSSAPAECPLRMSGQIPRVVIAWIPTFSCAMKSAISVI